jgi:hypothetical protein
MDYNLVNNHSMLTKDTPLLKNDFSKSKENASAIAPQIQGLDLLYSRVIELVAISCSPTNPGFGLAAF